MKTPLNASPNRMVTLISLIILQLLLINISAAQVNFDRADFCAKLKLTHNDAESDVFFPDVYSVMTEKTEFGTIGEEPISHSLSTIQFSEASGQMAVESESHDESFSAFADSKSNLCLLHHIKNGQCVKTTQPCDTIRRLTENLRLDQESVILKSTREILGWPQGQLKTAIKVGPRQTRDIDSILYVSCEEVENNTATVISQWHFLDAGKYKLNGNKPVLLMSRRETVNKNASLVNAVQIDYLDLKQIQSDKVYTSLELPRSKCFSSSMQNENKKIPSPPNSFIAIKETTVGRASGSPDNARDVEILYYNYDARWFHFGTHLRSVANNTETWIKVTEDFNTQVRYEIWSTGKGCTMFPFLSRAGHSEPDGITRMKTPSEFWNINPDTAVYLGEYKIRDVPCDAWRVGLHEGDRYENITLTIFLATKKWLNRRGLPVDSFVPLEYIEETKNIIKSHSYFGLKDNSIYFVPDISPCFGLNHSVAVRLTLLTSFYKNIKSHGSQFELNFRKAVMQFSGIESSLQVANIRARPSVLAPGQTRVTFKVISLVKTNSNPPGSQMHHKYSISDAAAKLKKAVKAGIFMLTQVINSEKILIKADPESFSLLKEVEDFQDNDEKISSSGYSIGLVVGLCILVLVVGAAVGFASVCEYKRWSDRKLKDLVEGNKAASSVILKAPPFGVLEMTGLETH
ncbi:hypothetical protein ElyMa_004659400 [Elysia marginata]|uniref:LolA-like domain-containing protein n=1 Tax=Elysia marginata TaxID=1093978 RepID=A0AAV4I4J4_9GAST|nr:hypothetical protein ElyMa_004659400 [Elysia marginata]